MDEKILNKIISAAYGDCSFIDKIKIIILTRQNPEAAKIYNDYREVAGRVHSLPVVECPEKILEKTEARIHLTGANRHFLKPVAAFAVIIIAAVVAMFSMLDKERPQTYTAAEVRTAEIQAKESLLMVSRILNKTTSTLEKEILPDKVSKPVKKGLTIINNLLIGG